MGSLADSRFWAKVDSRGPDECWPWLGYGIKGGYGQFTPYGGRIRVYAHRYSLELHLGRPLRPGMFACHRCDNPPCVNPAHLYEGDAKTNYRDMVERRRHPTAGVIALGSARQREVPVLSRAVEIADIEWGHGSRRESRPELCAKCRHSRLSHGAGCRLATCACRAFAVGMAA